MRWRRGPLPPPRARAPVTLSKNVERMVSALRRGESLRVTWKSRAVQCEEAFASDASRDAHDDHRIRCVASRRTKRRRWRPGRGDDSTERSFVSSLRRGLGRHCVATRNFADPWRLSTPLPALVRPRSLSAPDTLPRAPQRELPRTAPGVRCHPPRFRRVPTP